MSLLILINKENSKLFFFSWAHFHLLVSTEAKCFPSSFKILNRLHHASPTLYGTEHNSQERVSLSSLAIFQWLCNTWHVISLGGGEGTPIYGLDSRCATQQGMVF